MSPGAKNRRHFFRIVDSLGISYRIITGKESDMQDDGEETFVDTYSLMNNYNDVIQNALTDLQSRDPQAALAIEQLNKKVDAVLMMLELDSLMTHPVEHRVEQASISASGIAFPVGEQLIAGTMLALNLLLKPSTKNVIGIGKVISCESLQENSQYYLRVEFTEMNHQDKERLIQHIVQRQGALLRSLKNKEDSA